MGKRAFIMLLLFLVLVLPVQNVRAEGAFTFEEDATGKDMPGLQEGNGEKDTLFVTVESDKEVQKNDKAVLHIKGENGKEEDLGIDLYDAGVDVVEFRLLPGRYSVSDIQYIGTNRLIEDHGFGVAKEFLISGSGDNYLTIYIGEKKAAGITSETHLIKQNGKVADSLKAPSSDNNDGTVVTTREQVDADEGAADEAGRDPDLATGDSQKTEDTGKTLKDPDREEIVEKTGKKDDKKSGGKLDTAGIFNKFAVVFLFAIATGGFLFIWWRKNSR